jgi:hypothetical protein
MNATSQGGLFARQRTNHRIKQFFSSALQRLKRGLLLMSVVGIFFGLSSCDKLKGQSPDGKNNDQSIATSDSLKKPKVNIQVNRHFDDNGNMIGFDSTYSTFYSNVEGDTAKMDSLMHSFDSYFSRNHSAFLNRQMDPLFFNDSLRYPDFFHDDFFLRRYESNGDYFKGMMRRMDSIKNRFFYEDSKPKNKSNDIK